MDRRRLPARPESEKLTKIGWLLAIVALSIAASGFPAARFQVGGLLVHPVNVGSIALVLVGLPGLGRLPRRFIMTVLLFGAAFFASVLQAPGGWGYLVKLWSSLLILVAAAVAVRNDRDFRGAAVAVTFAVGVIGMRGILAGSVGLHGINPMEGIANKNSFSLYALPALLLAAFTILQRDTPKRTRVVLGLLSLISVYAIFSSANRSGWIGVVLIAALLSLRAIRSIKSFVIWLVLVAAGTFVVSEYADREVIRDRMERTREDFGQKRLELISQAIAVGEDNPLLGTSPQALPIEMARRTLVRGRIYDTHNAFAFIFGGAGGLTLLALLAIGVALWLRPRGFKETTRPAADAHFLLRAMLVLWLVRSQASAEILYNPAFSLTLGACVGLCAERGLWPQRGRTSRA